MRWVTQTREEDLLLTRPRITAEAPMAYALKVGKDERTGAGLGIVGVYPKVGKVIHRFAAHGASQEGHRAARSHQPAR